MVTIMCFWTLFWIIDLSQHSPPSYTLPNIIINMSSGSGWGNIMGVGLVDKPDYNYSKSQVFFLDTGTAESLSWIPKIVDLHNTLFIRKANFRPNFGNFLFCGIIPRILLPWERKNEPKTWHTDTPIIILYK